ncbi:hypothetical protein ACTFBT_01225 [Streptomyces microflavus]|uniref:Adenylate kinase n=1 Tax=Streptomyces microflavus TaxID=1919 RepID=A0A7J0D658_STRMI|nr:MULTISPECIES: hypothetical protein [Streptomyces]MDX2978152.1 hypothetical protein [Streptomyces sp. NRRL_B-2249]GFN09557.1 hypothetical protein Smic_81130 [Streptomyces microflavus]GGX67166.1 hypothetical protein GCM10010298_34870 [Streptomyces microflavus]
MGNVGIIGRARVGKDTAGQWLVDNRGYRRIGFADPLKEAALKLDPLIEQIDMAYLAVDERPDVRLSDLVGSYGWEEAKEAPEVRRILQELGAAVRAIDEDFWLRAAMARVQEANEAGVPAVITDVRYPNEAASLRRAGFHLVYIERPDVEQLVHESEGALGAEDADVTIHNGASLDAFLYAVEGFARHVERVESRRHYARSH